MIRSLPIASEETVSFSAPHAPHENAIKAYGNVLDNIKQAVEENRELWRATPEMWSRAEGITTDKLLGDLTADSIGKYLVEIRSGPTSYGTILLGKIKIPNFKDDLGEGFLHVRYVGRQVHVEVSILIKLHGRIHDSPGDVSPRRCLKFTF